jgi:hypothetical protein
MGPPIPVSIKIAVLEGWLKGFSRKSIAQRNNIGDGTVSGIIQKARDGDPDFDLMRMLAVALKKENLDVVTFATLVRLKRVLARIELPEEKLESLLEAIQVHCFRQGKNEKDFISKIDEVFDLAAELDTSIWGINSQISQRRVQIEDLDRKIALKQKELARLHEQYSVTVDDLEDYRFSRSTKNT